MSKPVTLRFPQPVALPVWIQDRRMGEVWANAADILKSSVEDAVWLVPLISDPEWVETLHPVGDPYLMRCSEVRRRSGR